MRNINSTLVGNRDRLQVPLIFFNYGLIHMLMDSWMLRLLCCYIKYVSKVRGLDPLCNLYAINTVLFAGHWVPSVDLLDPVNLAFRQTLPSFYRHFHLFTCAAGSPFCSAKVTPCYQVLAVSFRPSLATPPLQSQVNVNMFVISFLFQCFLVFSFLFPHFQLLTRFLLCLCRLPKVVGRQGFTLCNFQEAK